MGMAAPSLLEHLVQSNQDLMSDANLELSVQLVHNPRGGVRQAEKCLDAEMIRKKKMSPLPGTQFTVWVIATSENSSCSQENYSPVLYQACGKVCRSPSCLHRHRQAQERAWTKMHVSNCDLVKLLLMDSMTYTYPLNIMKK